VQFAFNRRCLIMRINPPRLKEDRAIWSAPAERSGDGALDDHGTHVDQSKAALLWLCHADARQVYDLPSRLYDWRLRPRVEDPKKEKVHALGKS
jgi:hypothetical protein